MPAYATRARRPRVARIDNANEVRRCNIILSRTRTLRSTPLISIRSSHSTYHPRLSDCSRRLAATTNQHRRPSLEAPSSRFPFCERATASLPSSSPPPRPHCQLFVVSFWFVCSIYLLLLRSELGTYPNQLASPLEKNSRHPTDPKLPLSCATAQPAISSFLRLVSLLADLPLLLLL
jgi:hypothetical protein